MSQRKKQTELDHTTIVQKRIISENWHKRW